ncbi:Crp/Fnr family transcriptional regulator [Paenibacillus sp. FSL K6-1217]|uniref:Crp/Fnr family transcriptional regulator n=1 Tax=Paenibacillus sp. FSL K6-1217 TaxID=2921466 RepID=UPI003254073A
MECNTCSSHTCVRQVPVFRGLSDAELVIIESITESHSYKKGSQVCREGEASEALYVVKNGLIKLTKNSKEGKQHIVRFLFPGDYFGQFALLHNKNNDVTAEMIESGVVCRMHRKDFIPLLEKNAGLAFSFLMSVSEQLHLAEESAGALHMFEVEKRLARLLVYLYTRNLPEPAMAVQALRHSVDLPSAQKEVAAMIGTTAETLSRKLNKLEALKIIAMHKRTVNILEMEALIQLAEISN